MRGALVQRRHSPLYVGGGEGYIAAVKLHEVEFCYEH